MKNDAYIAGLPILTPIKQALIDLWDAYDSFIYWENNTDNFSEVVQKINDVINNPKTSYDDNEYSNIMLIPATPEQPKWFFVLCNNNDKFIYPDIGTQSENIIIEPT